MIRGAGRALVAAATAVACAKAAPVPEAQPQQAASATCSATVGTLPAGTSANAILGSHELTLVATRGPQAGRSLTGTLTVERASASRIAGTSVIALESVGATAPGPVSSSNRYPVEVLEWSTMRNGVATPQITVRFGSITAPSGTQRIEGEHMALSVNTIAGTGFSGTWESGDGTGVSTVGGHFCAR